MSNTAPTATKASTPPDKRAQHTPGPWKVVPDSTCSGAWLTVCADGDVEREVCRTDTFAINQSRKALTITEDADCFDDLADADEIRANANLIAAAPELLDNLAKTNLFLFHVASCLVTTEPAKGLLQGHIELNKAAIAAAEGRAK